MNTNIDYSLYLVTDSKLVRERKLEDVVEEAISGGVTLVQLREKNISSLEFYNLAKSIKKVTSSYKVPLIINDRLDIALAVDADGIHIGQNDLPCEVVRKFLEKDKIVGVSAHNLSEALKAEKKGATYLGCGAVFSTLTKTDVSVLKKEELKKIKDAVSIPIVAIGGINEKNVLDLSNTNIDGIAVVSAIIGKNDIRCASQKMKEKFYKLK